MANNLKKKLIRENPIIARLQDPKYRVVNFLRSVNGYTNYRYPTEKQIEVANKIMDEFDKGEKIQPLADLSRRSIIGTVVSVRRVPRNKAYYNLITVKCKQDQNSYIMRETKALAGVKVGNKITVTASLERASIPSTYFLRKPTKTYKV